MADAVIFFEFEIFDVRFGISVPKDIKMTGIAIAFPKKMVITTRPTVATVWGNKLKLVQHSLVFRVYTMSKGSLTGVNLQPIYELISTYFFQNFPLFLAAGTNLTKKSHFAASNYSIRPARKILKLIFKSLRMLFVITECHDTQKCLGNGDKK